MVVSIAGIGYSGSGALIDLLKEFDENSVMDNVEYNILYIPDGIRDLEHHLCEESYRFFSSNSAIYRFKLAMKSYSELFQKKLRSEFIKEVNKYIEKITQLSWKGYSLAHYYEYNSVERLFIFRIPANLLWRMKKLGLNKHISLYKPKRTMFLSVQPENFIKETKCFLHNTLEILGADFEKNVVVDQLTTPFNYFRLIKYFDEIKIIRVIRDPRDIYILLKDIYKGNESFVPTNDVNDFIKYYSIIVHNDVDIDNCLTVKFEDMIYKYDSTINIIKDFLKINDWKLKKQYFDPQISKNNTQLFKRIHKYASDIKLIEQYLNEYLYDFPEIENIDNCLETF